jgi:hypothetical protein
MDPPCPSREATDTMSDVPETLEADYLVVGAGAMAMAFVDALVDHADVKVVMVDRRYGVGGHWLDAYPFVRVHQASQFYGVASTLLGGGRVQADGPEAGLHERSTAPEVCAYYARVLRDRMVASGRVTFHPRCEYVGDRTFVSLLSGRRYEVSASARVVDATYLAPEIPATTPPPFAVGDGVRVVPVNDLVRIDHAPSQYVVTGSGKTATDACVWLIDNGVDPDRICWVRPRDPWMLNRAAVQPDPVVYQGMSADMVEAALEATSPDDFFLRLEAAGVMLRIDPTVRPTMAKAPTLATWELDRLRSVENVVRLGRVRAVEPGRLVLDEGEARIDRDAVVVHCAAPGLQYPALVPVWSRDAITLQLVRAAAPCFNAALIGYVEATRDSDDEKNRLCPPSSYGNTTQDWSRMQVVGYRAVSTFLAEPDIAAWASGVTINPARVAPGLAESDPAVAAAVARYRRSAEPGFARLAVLAGMG